MKLFKRFSLFLFFFLLFIILGEIIFLLSFNKSKDNLTSNYTRPFSYESLFQSKEFLRYFQKLGLWADNKLLKALIVTEEYEGKVKEIKKENNIDGNFSYDLKIRLYSPKYNIETIRLFNKRDLSLMKFYEKGKSKNINLDDINKGDYIKLSITSDYLKPPEINLISGYIERIEKINQ